MNHRDRSDNSSISSSQNLNLFKNTPRRVRCDIGDTQPFLKPPASVTSSLANMVVDVDSLRAPLTTLFVDNTGLDHIICLERAVCSDYLCCGNQYPDLHALLEHFEEEHVVVFAPNGRRLYPSEGFRTVHMPVEPSPVTTPASSRSASAIPLSPSLSLSCSCSTSSSSSAASASTSMSHRKPSLPVPVPSVYTPFTPGLPVDPADPYGPEEIVDVMSHDEEMYSFQLELLHPFPLFSASTSFDSDGMSPPEFYPSSSSGSGSDGDEDKSDTSSSPIPAYACGTDKIRPIAAIPKHVSFSATASTSGLTRKGGRSSSSVDAIATPTTAKSKSRNRGTPSGASRRREKMYRCPEPRCTKAYLNPNGLKYHMEKGTCKLENEVERNISEESTHSDSSPITYQDRTQRPSPSPAADRDVQMRDSSGGSGGEVSLGQGHHAPCATATIFPPSDSNAPTPIPHARHPGQAEASGAVTSSPVIPGHHHLQPQHVTVVSVGADAPPSTASQAQAFTQPLQEQPQPSAVYHYPFPTYPPPRFLGGANDIPGSSAPAAQYPSTSYYHRPYYVSATTSNGAADIISAQRPPSSYAAPPQPPIPIAVSSSRLQ